MRRVRGGLVRAVLAASLAVALVACGSNTGGTDDGDSSDDGASSETTAAAEARSLNVAPTVPGPLYWSYYWSAGPLGFYDEANLDVEIIPVEASVPQAMLSGQLDIGGVGSDFIPQGAEIDDLRWVMMTDAYLFAAIVPDDSELESVSDLAGARIGINDPHDEFDAEFLLTSNGIERGDYELVPLGEAVPVAQAMLEGEIDAMINPVGSAWIQINDAFPDAGFRTLDSPGTDGFYNTGIIASQDMIENERETVVEFSRSIAKAWIWMQENPEATAEAVMEAEPSAAESEEEALRFISRAAEFNSGIYEDRGEIHEDIIQQTIDLSAELGFIEESYDAASIIDTSLHEEIWDFDVEAEIEAARAAGN